MIRNTLIAIALETGMGRSFAILFDERDHDALSLHYYRPRTAFDGRE